MVLFFYSPISDSSYQPCLKFTVVTKCFLDSKQGFKLPDSVKATTAIEDTVKFGKVLLVVIPVPFLGKTLTRVKDLIQPDHIIVSCAKGILVDTLETPDDILKGVLPPELHSRLAFMSGPSFAAEVAKGQPTAVTVASQSPEVAEQVQNVLSTPFFRCYRTQDVKGAELGGALKNVIAIACGISDGLEYGPNARAALITRGLSELVQLAVKCGANPLTLQGLSGLGDLVLTATGDLSRNRTVGMRIGKGETLEDIQKSMKTVAEGVLTSKAVYHLAQKTQTDCPVLTGIYRVIHEGADPRKVVLENMSRPLREEISPFLVEAAHRA